MGTVIRGKVQRADLALWDGKTFTSTRVDATGGTITGLPLNDYVDTLQVYGNGTAQDVGAIAAAVRRIGSANVTLKYSPGTWEVTEDLTVPSNFSNYIPAGCVFNVASGKTLTFSGPVFRESDTYQTGSGTIVNPGGLLGSSTFYPKSTAEDTNSATVANLVRKWGDIVRYGAVVDGSTDDTAKIQEAIDSGHPAFSEEHGTANVAGKLVLDGDKSLKLNAGFTLEDQAGTSSEPLIHLYGNKNLFDTSTCTIRADLNTRTGGIIRIGAAAGETEGGTTDVQCYENQIRGHFKLLGPWSAQGVDGTVGIYVESIRRKKFTVSNPCYDTTIDGGRIFNCDIGFVASTDVNRSRFKFDVYQWGTAAVITNASYGNKFDINIEAPQAITPEAWREAVHLGTQNYLSTESGTDATYAITAAYRNYFHIYAELAGSGTSKARVINYNEPGSSAAEGRNDLDIIGQFGGGIGEDGTTQQTGVGSNRGRSSIGYFDYTRPWALHDFNFRALDDGTGSHFGSNVFKFYSERVTPTDENTTYNIWVHDNLGTTSATMLLKLFFAGKVSGDATEEGHVGEMTFGCFVKAGSAQTVIKTLDAQSNHADGNPGDWSVAAAAGTTANTGKFTLQLTTNSLTGSNNDFFYDWFLIAITSQLEGTNIDWDANVSIPNGT